MLLNFIKLIIDTPEKITHALISCTKYIFSILFAIALFQFFAGNHWPTMPQWNADWIEMLLKKQLLLFIFFYALSYFLLFELFKAFYSLLLQQIPKLIKFKKVENEIFVPIFLSLRQFDLLDQDKKTGRPKAAKKTELLHDFLKSFTERKDDIEETTGPLLAYDIPYCYTLFVIYYFTNIALASHAIIFDSLLIIGAFIMPIIVTTLERIYEYLQKNAHHLLLYTEALIAERDIEKNLKERGVIISKRDLKIGNQQESYFRYMGEEYLFNLLYTDGPIPESSTRRFIDRLSGSTSKLIIFTNSLPDQDAQAKIDAVNDRLFIIHIDNIDAIPQIIRSRIKGNFVQNIIL